MDKIIKFTSISELHKQLGYANPKHPLISVLDLSNLKNVNHLADVRIVSSYYSIYVKTGTSSIKYGRNYYDFEEGSLIAMAPEQVFSFSENEELSNLGGGALYFHPDLIRKYPLAKKINEYGFFSYETNEALHLSDEEQQIVTDLILKIEKEFDQSIDKHSQKLIVSNIELLLNYCMRYYDRQFYVRTNLNQDHISDFEHLLMDYFESDKPSTIGLPSVNYCGEELNMSSNYLSDLLKKETGKSAKDHIYSFVVDRAKNMLLGTTDSISEIAFDLGFEYSQHFSKMFKRQTGMSPNKYRSQN